MIANFKLYELNDNILNLTPDEIIKFVGNDWSGFNSREEAIEELEYIIDELKNLPHNITLYRVLLLEDDQPINEEQIGEHFVADESLTYEQGWLEKIGVWDNWNEYNKLWLLKCTTNKNNIDIVATIGNRLVYPREYEYTLMNDSNINIINKKIINKKQTRI